jgi:hypothetical protein
MPGNMDAYHSECADRGPVVDEYLRIRCWGTRRDCVRTRRIKGAICFLQIGKDVRQLTGMDEQIGQKLYVKA